MSENSKIEWTDHTFNPWEGCQKVGAGCDHCYAEARNARFGGGIAANWGPGAPRRRTSEANWRKPLQWNANACWFVQCNTCGWRGETKGATCGSCHGCDTSPARQRVFCASLADVFDNAVDREWRDDLATLILATPNLDWLLLTKRIGNAGAMLGEMFLDGPPNNIRIGITICNQPEADHNILKLLALGLPNFLSMEPLLGPVDLSQIPISGHGHHEFDPIVTANVLKRHETHPPLPRVNWVIVGGESGPGARPIHPDWARSLRDQCTAAGTPFLFKQWGEHDLSYDRERDDPDYRRCNSMDRLPGRWINLAGGHGFNGERVHYAHRVGKKAAGRLLDGREWNEVPT